jgi:DNA polymerase-3 subunit beta
LSFIQASRDAILKPLMTVAGIVEKRHTLPILANVMMRKDAERVTFLASDIEIQISTTAELSRSAETVATTVSARKLIDILKALPDNIDVTIRVDDKRATLSAGRSRFTLQTMPVEDFPTVKTDHDWPAGFRLPQKQLRHLFQMVHFSMAVQDVRYYLNGLLLVTSRDRLRVVATDGHRLAYCEAAIDAPDLATREVIIPRKSILELQRLLADTDDPVDVDLADNQLRLRFGEVEFVTKLVEGKFPDYQRVIPSAHSKRLLIPRESLAASLSRASILTSDKFRGVRLTLEPGALKIQANNAEQEEAQEEVETDYQGERLEIGFNVGYLQDVLANLKTEQIQAEFGDSNTSALITVPGDSQFKYVVMPMRI